MRRYLVVANQTLGSGELFHELRQRYTDETSAFYLLVPATLSTGATGPSAPPADETVEELVQRRLDTELNLLKAAGVQADGEVGHEDPVRAVNDLLDRRQFTFDEVIVATFPRGVSRWLGMDLLNKVKHKAQLPVTHVVCKRPTRQ